MPEGREYQEAGNDTERRWKMIVVWLLESESMYAASNKSLISCLFQSDVDGFSGIADLHGYKQITKLHQANN